MAQQISMKQLGAEILNTLDVLAFIDESYITSWKTETNISENNIELKGKKAITPIQKQNVKTIYVLNKDKDLIEGIANVISYDEAKKEYKIIAKKIGEGTGSDTTLPENINHIYFTDINTLKDYNWGDGFYYQVPVNLIYTDASFNTELEDGTLLTDKDIIITLDERIMVIFDERLCKKDTVTLVTLSTEENDLYEYFIYVNKYIGEYTRFTLGEDSVKIAYTYCGLVDSSNPNMTNPSIDDIKIGMIVKAINVPNGSLDENKGIVYRKGSNWFEVMQIQSNPRHYFQKPIYLSSFLEEDEIPSFGWNLGNSNYIKNTQFPKFVEAYGKQYRSEQLCIDKEGRIGWIDSKLIYGDGTEGIYINLVYDPDYYVNILSLNTYNSDFSMAETVGESVIIPENWDEIGTFLIGSAWVDKKYNPINNLAGKYVVDNKGHLGVIHKSMISNGEGGYDPHFTLETLVSSTCMSEYKPGFRYKKDTLCYLGDKTARVAKDFTGFKFMDTDEEAFDYDVKSKNLILI